MSMTHNPSLQGHGWNWYVGQRVVCVDADGFSSPYPDVVFPRLGQILTIRCVERGYVDGEATPAFSFVEIVNPTHLYECSVRGRLRCELNFRAGRFRPIRETDISVFEAMLRDVPALVEA